MCEELQQLDLAVMEPMGRIGRVRRFDVAGAAYPQGLEEAIHAGLVRRGLALGRDVWDLPAERDEIAGMPGRRSADIADVVAGEADGATLLAFDLRGRAGT